MSRPIAAVRWFRGCLAALALLCVPAWGQVPPAILLAETYKATRDVVIADYWISEKLDGVRAIWDGKALYFRSCRRNQSGAGTGRPLRKYNALPSQIARTPSSFSLIQ